VLPKEYKDTVAELNGSRTNCVFEFFKITAPERLGFAKHREAADRKAVALAAAEADTGETVTSPRAGGTPSKKITKKIAPTAATTVAAKGKAQKKRGARPTDSPPRPPKRRALLTLTLASWVLSSLPCLCALLHLREVLVERLAAHCSWR
jgi:hypothetical protein